MHSLADHIARRRILYQSPMISAPSVLVIDIPLDHRGPGLALGRYYAVIVETDDELLELESFLIAPRETLVPPTILDYRPSALRSARVLISRYEPPEPGWPWLNLCRWPESFTHAADAPEMARGSYTMELFDTPQALDAHNVALLDALGARHEISIRMINSDALPPAGHA